MQSTVRVVVQGALGRVGKEMLNAISREPGMRPVGAIEKNPSRSSLILAGDGGEIPLSGNVVELLQKTRPDVLVDFSTIEAARESIPIAIRENVSLVIGTTGFTEDDIARVRALVEGKPVGILIAPNFSIGAVLLVRMSRMAARYFDFAEIIELHHEQKLDAPSGTSLSTARAMMEARGKPFECPQTQKQTLTGTRGGQVDGIAIHSIRLPGLMAHQEVIFGGLGQTLTIRHDSISRESFVPGVLFAIGKVICQRGLVVGLENLLDL